MFLKKEQIPEVALPQMNEVHEQEVEVLNRLLKAIEAYEERKANAQVIDILFDEFIKDVIQHFNFEQGLMEEFNFFAYPVHRAEHDRVLSELRIMKKKWQEERDIETLKDYLEKQFIPWLINHIQSMDTITAIYLSKFDIK